MVHSADAFDLDHTSRMPQRSSITG